MPRTPSLRELRERDERLHRRTILKFGHLSKGRLSARDREIVEARRQALQHNIERIWAEQEAENARLRALVATFADKPRLRVGKRYATRACLLKISGECLMVGNDSCWSDF